MDSMLLHAVGHVTLTVDAAGISWTPIESEVASNSCFCSGDRVNVERELKFSDVYAVEFKGWGSILDGNENFLGGGDLQMYRFVVHTFRRGKLPSSPWVLLEYVFGHEDLHTCQAWVEKLNTHIKNGTARPKNLLVFVHPLCGKGIGKKTWETVAPIFSRAKVETEVMLTERAGHAFDKVTSLSDGELRSYDGIVAVGGDGLFNEILNGLLSSRHTSPYPPTPSGINCSRNSSEEQVSAHPDKSSGRISTDGVNNFFSLPSDKSDDHEPLLSTTESYGSVNSKFTTNCGPGTSDSDQERKITFPNDWFRLGLIPAGSTDAIVLSTTGVRDPMTSALHIILGKKMALDIAQIVRWKVHPSSTDVPFVRYAASFAGYGFYGEVVQESEKYRWMGPIRYDYAGTMAFLKHRSYEAEITFLKTEKGGDQVNGTIDLENGTLPLKSSEEIHRKIICRKNCTVCNLTTELGQQQKNPSIHVHSESSGWLKSKGRFLSVGAAIMSCRNERAPDGLVADAHLADGFLHLILIKDCSRPYYLWHLTKLARRGSDPFNFAFVEHHKTSAFTFVSSKDDGMWNLDGELFQACQVSVQVCRCLVNLFASGPEA